MTTPATPSNPKSSGDDRNLVPVDATNAVTFDDQLHVFWKKNGTAILIGCGLIVAAILAKGAWEHNAKGKQAEIGTAYAAAKTPEQLKAFASAHPDHELAGIAQLRLADEAFAAGKSADALAAYEKAADAIEEGPLAARARLGRGLAKAQAGKTAEAVTDLKQLAGEANQFRAIRSEATYHLASLAAEAGNAAEVQKYSEQLNQIDPASPWVSRVLALRASLPAPAPADAAPAAPPAGSTKKDEASPSVEIKLPGK